MNTTTPLDRFYALDETITRIKDEHQREMISMRDECVQRRADVVAMNRLLSEAQEDRDRYMRLATKLIAQFGAVELIFSEAKALAIAYSNSIPSGESPPTDPNAEPPAQREPGIATPAQEFVRTLDPHQRALDAIQSAIDMRKADYAKSEV